MDHKQNIDFFIGMFWAGLTRRVVEIFMGSEISNRLFCETWRSRRGRGAHPTISILRQLDRGPAREAIPLKERLS